MRIYAHDLFLYRLIIRACGGRSVPVRVAREMGCSGRTDNTRDTKEEVAASKWEEALVVEVTFGSAVSCHIFFGPLSSEKKRIMGNNKV